MVRGGGSEDRSAESRQRLEEMSEREQGVAVAAGRGLSNAETAGEVCLSVPRVKAHASRLFDKIQVTN